MKDDAIWRLRLTCMVLAATLATIGLWHLARYGQQSAAMDVIVLTLTLSGLLAGLLCLEARKILAIRLASRIQPLPVAPAHLCLTVPNYLWMLTGVGGMAGAWFFAGLAIRLALSPETNAVDWAMSSLSGLMAMAILYFLGRKMFGIVGSPPTQLMLDDQGITLRERGKQYRIHWCCITDMRRTYFGSRWYNRTWILALTVNEPIDGLPRGFKLGFMRNFCGDAGANVALPLHRHFLVSDRVLEQALRSRWQLMRDRPRTSALFSTLAKSNSPV